MYFKIIISSIRQRRSIYIPMLIAVSISLCLIGAETIVKTNFNGIMNKEMRKYGANVILKPPIDDRIIKDEKVPVHVEEESVKGINVQTAGVRIKELLKMNPAWLVKGNPGILVGEDAAAKLGLHQGDTAKIAGVKDKVAILESGTIFDSFVFIEKKVNQPDMELIRAKVPATYKGTNAVILNEMVESKNAVLESTERLMFFVALISMIVSIASIINLSRIDTAARRKELGIFKSLGASYRSILKLVSGEFMLLALVSTAAGILGAVLLSRMILSYVAGSGASITFNSVFYVSLTSLTAFSVAVLVYIFESRRMSASEELRNE